MGGRTAKDEREYHAQLRREEPIKSEVIVELRNQNRALWQTQHTLLKALIEAQDALRVYRLHQIDAAKRCGESGNSCAAGCTRHTWDSIDGWHRLAEPKAEKEPV